MNIGVLFEEKKEVVEDVCAPLSSVPLVTYQLVEWSKANF
jgi:hypothetical protein